MFMLIGSRILKVGFVFAVTALAYFSIPAAVIAIVATILVALNEKAGGIVELSFGPLKTKLERDLSEAEKLLGKLRLLLQLQAKASISAGVRAGRWASEDGWLYDNVRSLESAMKDVGLSEDQIKDARQEFVRFTIIDAKYAAFGSHQVPSFLGHEAATEWTGLRSGDQLEIDKIENFLNKWGLHSPERTQILEDVKWMLENQDVRDREQYLRSQRELPWVKD